MCQYRETALHYACRGKDLEIIKLLLEQMSQEAIDETDQACKI